MSLPIETIVIVAVGVMVLVVMAVFFISGAGRQILLISDQQALTSGCSDFALRYSCKIADIGNVRISNYNTTCGSEINKNTLTVACCKAGYTDPTSCAVMACRCPPA